MTRSTDIKYVDPNRYPLPLLEDRSAIDHSVFHTADEFEVGTRTVKHSTFQELHDAVFLACPKDFVCVEPIALHHEVLWTMGLSLTVDVNGEHVFERDQLHHAVEEEEYESLPWGKIKYFCVDVVPVGR